MDEIIADIYHAAVGTKPWSDPLTKIVDALNLRGSQVVGLSTSSGAITYSHASEQVTSEIELEYVRTYHTVDPRKELLLVRQAGHWLYDQDVFDDGVAESNACYRDFIIPHGARHSATVKLLDRDGEVVILGFVSHPGLEGFAERHRETLQSITFHLREAAKIYQQTRKLTTAAFAGTEMLHRLSRPALLLSVDRRLSFMNAAAKRYFEEGHALMLARDKLFAMDRSTDDALLDAFRDIAHDLEQGGNPKRRVLRLASRQPAPTAVLSLTPFVPSESMFAFGTQPQVLAVVHVCAVEATPDIMLWEAAFNLTPAQARVGLALFRGRSLEQVAEDLHITPATVRSHLQVLYSKTESKRQAQLVSTLAAIQS